MKNIIWQYALILFSIISLSSCSSNSTDSDDNDPNMEIAIDTTEAANAFVYLNTVRANPPMFSQECNYSLSDIIPRPALNYNAILEKVAQEKALDMAKRNYTAHQNPEGKGIDHRLIAEGYPLDKEDYYIDESTANYESLQMAGTSASPETLTGVKAVRDLIWDGGVKNGGHRFHLLGVGDRSTLDEIGIGFARAKSSTMYKNYTCIIIAKRKR